MSCKGFRMIQAVIKLLDDQMTRELKRIRTTSFTKHFMPALRETVSFVSPRPSRGQSLSFLL